jgi:CPA2 family monovalent cation:H+ antiporter-2
VPVIVRTQDDHDLEKLMAAGATEVVPETLESSLMLASHALALVGVPMRRVIRVVQDQRDARYNLLRGYFHGADDSTAQEMEQERLSTVDLDRRCRRRRPGAEHFRLPDQGVRVVSLRRANGHLVDPATDPALQDGDTLVLSGRPELRGLAAGLGIAVAAGPGLVSASGTGAGGSTA